MRAKQTSKMIRRVRRHRLALALVAALAPAAAVAQSLPTGGTVVNGNASITPGGNTLTISQTTRGAIINWGTFNIGSGYGVTFNQPSNGVTLNRVLGTLASDISGNLTANGNVFIVNTNGITFGSSAQVNVGGLVASTLALSDAAFLGGLASGSFQFSGTTGTPSITNNADIIVGAGGLGFVGPTLYNRGAIVATGGNIGFGAATTVTLDFVGDGLTQVTINAAPGVDSGIIQERSGSMTADGGRILLRTAATAAGTGGAIYADGNLRARGIANANGRVELTSSGGAVMLGAPGIISDASSPFTAGSIDVTGQNGGSVLIQGNGVFMVNSDDTPLSPTDPLSTGSFINASGALSGGTVQIQSTGDVTMLPLARIVADGDGAAGGLVQVAAVGDALLLGDISASSKTGDGGAIAAVSTTGNVLLTGSANAVGGGNGGTVALAAPQGVLGIGGFVGASGLGAGGQVTGIADTILLGAASQVDANGGTVGGQVGFSARTGLAAYGVLTARGDTAGGSIATATGGSFDIRGLTVDAGSNGGAGLWTLWAPNIDVVDGGDAGPVGGTVLGTAVQDADINSALATGTSVTLRAGTVPSDGGDIVFQDGVDIFYDDGTVPLAFRADAQGSIFGTNFSIGANAAALSMAFNADANNLNNGFGYIDFSGATLESNGGDIQFYGQSDAANGVASSYATGVRLANSSITSAGGDVLIRGASTGSDAGGDDAGVVLEATPIDAGSGIVTIYGSGAGVTNGAVLRAGSINADSVSIDGQSTNADGIVGDGSDITATGDITLIGTGGARGVAFFGGLYSNGGSIGVDGTGGTGDGIDITGPVDSAGGDVTMHGLSQQAKGLVFGGGVTSGLVSAGGDILLTGNGVTGGVELQQSVAGPILLFGPSDVDTVNSSGGSLTVTGTASGTGAIGVYSNGVDLIGAAGDVTIDGSAPLGTGVLFANGAGVSTTSGAITLDGTGEAIGLDASGGVLSTSSGDITLVGNAVGGSALAGVLMYSGNLITAGGDIRADGTANGGIGVLFGLRGGFGMASGGGDITVDGSGGTAGAWLQGGNIDSGGGNITVGGTASGGDGTGVALIDTLLAGTSGAVSVLGIASAGTGVDFIGKSGISTTTGAIGVTGIGATVGLALTGGTLSTDSGHFDLRGRGIGAASDGLVIGTGVDIATNGGGIELSGEGGSGAGVSLTAGARVDARNSLVVIRAGNDGSSDALRIAGTIASSVGVNLRPGGVDANGGLTEHVDDEILIGGGSTGFALSGAELALIDSPELIIGANLHAGAIQVLGGINRNGNLTLQNDGGSGGIDLQAAVNVGGGVLALSSGGDITQASTGAITAHSLLARAGGSVLLASADNNVAATTLAGSAGGDFEYQDVDALAIGNVSALGMDAGSNGLASVGASGISAGGDVFVRNLAGDLTLDANVSGTNIDLVTANTLQNTAGASLIASGDWRVWASTWVGESRGGLAGNGNLPNLYGCVYLGGCGVTFGVNQFRYAQRPTAVVTFDSFSREYGLPNPVFSFSVTGAILGDVLANVASGSASIFPHVGSNVGTYEISGARSPLGTFSSAAGYNIQFIPGTMTISPATLVFTADGFVRYLGTDNPLFTGTVSGFRNGDTVQSVFGDGVIWTSPAGILSPIGFYPINGGTSATNYVFAQAPGNATALQIIPLPQLSSTPIDLIRETVNSYVYDRNFGGAPMCAVNASLEDQQLVSMGDELSNEWSKVRSRPNLTNCFETDRKNSCGDF